MPFADTLPDDGRLAYEECIQHIRFTLADICVQAWDNRVSLWRFLNRVVFFFQAPLCFAVFRASKKGYTFERTTMRDPLYEREFSVALADIGVGLTSSSRLRPRKATLQPYLVRLLATEFYIAAFRVEGGRHQPCRHQEVRYVPLRQDADSKVDQAIFRSLTLLFSPFGSALRIMGIEGHLNDAFRRLFLNEPYVVATGDNPEKHQISERGERDVEGHFLELARLLDEEIDRILPSPAIMQSGVSNFLLGIKVFNRRSTRFGCYYYNIRLYLPESQKEQLRTGLTLDALSCMPPFCYKPAHLWIENCVRAKAFDDIFAILATPLSSASRLFCEYTLRSGVSITNLDPFSRGDIGWYESKFAPGQTGDFEHEMRRFAAIHYVLLRMAGPDITRPALLTLPIRVDGVTWMSVTAVVSAEERHDYPGVVSAEEFEQRFLFYHSLMTDFENRLRRKTKQTYLLAVSGILREQLQAAFDRTGRRPEDRNSFSQQDFREVCERTTDLCRLYPFKPIMFSDKAVREHLQWKALNLGDWFDIDCGLVRANPFFDRTPLRSFLSNEEVRDHIWKFMNAYLANRWLSRKLLKVRLPQ